MTNDTYYKGFEGEGEICFTSGENNLIIWEGYFDTLYHSIFDKAEKGGMMEAYTKCEDGYDWVPGRPEDVEKTIRQLSCFTKDDPALPTWKEELEEVKNIIISFLQQNKNRKMHVEFD